MKTKYGKLIQDFIDDLIEVRANRAEEIDGIFGFLIKQRTRVLEEDLKVYGAWAEKLMSKYMPQVHVVDYSMSVPDGEIQ